MKAFTLIETLIAITILTLAVAGPSFIASRAIIAAQTARDHLTALYLAQEGIEHVRMMRDNQYLAAYQGGGENVSREAWEEFLSGGGSDPSTIAKCLEPKVCTLDPAPENDSPLGHCPGNRCRSLYLTGCTDGPEGRSCTPPNIYTQEDSSGSVEMPFTRTIQAVEVSPTEVKIISMVSWTFRDVPYSVSVSDHLTSWK